MDKHKHHADTARAFIALLIVAIMGAVFLIFYNYRDNIVESQNYNTFITLAIIAGGLLIGLMYLANKPHVHKKSSVSKTVRKPVKKAVKASKKSKSAKRK